ncbi:MAG: hypothetical protein ABGY96_12290 [bacterium]|nr:hypothetical protein [Gammaproteobacteria bacterium]HIL96899.1 hypothetical protein [Pseudomonadales bacterium]
MADAYSLAKKHLDEGVAAAAAENIDLNKYGQALVWKLLELYVENGRDLKDINEEIQYTIENLGGDGIFHVVRN